MADNKAPVEGKVWGATVGTGAGATTSTFVLWLLGVLVWGASSSAESATDAVAAVPFPVMGLVALLITVGGGFAGGYLAKHTVRLDFFDDEVAADVPVWKESMELPVDPALENESLEEYEARQTVSTDEDGDGRDDNNGRFVSRSE